VRKPTFRFLAPLLNVRDVEARRSRLTALPDGTAPAHNFDYGSAASGYHIEVETNPTEFTDQLPFLLVDGVVRLFFILVNDGKEREVFARPNRVDALNVIDLGKSLSDAAIKLARGGHTNNSHSN